MGFRLDLPIGLPSASCSRHTIWPLAILSPLGSNIFVFTYWSPHYGVASGFLSNMGNMSASSNFSLYESYCTVSSTFNSTESLTLAWEPSLWCKDFMNLLCSTLHSYCFHSFWVIAWYDDLWKTWPFSLIFFDTKVGPLSMLQPSFNPI